MAGCVTEADIAKAMRIKGYMQPEELAWLAEQAKTHGRIAEVGSYYGRSTRAICDNAAGEVHAFDDFWGPRDLILDWRTRGIIYDIFKDNLKDHIDSMKLIVHEVDHRVVAPIPKYFDMVFLDGSHEYYDFKDDLERWIPAVGDGGMICGHDFDLAYPGVIHALNECIGPKYYTRAQDTTIWYALPNGKLHD